MDQVLAQFPAQVNEFYNGNDKILQFLIGQAMKATRGQANPSELSAILRARLNPPK